MADLSYAREASEYVIAADLPDSQREAALRAYLAAAESCDRRIKELEADLRMARSGRTLYYTGPPGGDVFRNG